MQEALKCVEDWYREENLRVNPLKTALIVFTRKREVKFTTPKLFDGELQVEKHVKYLGVILDSKLTWNNQLQHICKRGIASLMAARKAIGKVWGLKPKVVHWLYNMVIKPQIKYGSIVWWPKVNQRQAEEALNKVQRLACLSITGAMRSTPTMAMEAILSLTPLNIFIKGEAGKSAHRLQCNNLWREAYYGHSKITREITSPMLKMGSDAMQKMFNFEPHFQTTLDYESWSSTQNMSTYLIWYTDGSKTNSGTGSGVCGLRPRKHMYASLGKTATIFQAEIYALIMCIMENLRREYTGKRILILLDSMAVIRSVSRCEIRSKLIWDCLGKLNQLGRQNKVTLAWIKGHSGIPGNIKADFLAKQGAAKAFVGPEPMFGTTKESACKLISEWEKQNHVKEWQQAKGLRHSKIMIMQPMTSNTTQLLNLSRPKLSQITGLLTGHCGLRKHLQKMGIYKDDPLCRQCCEEDETAFHIIFECPALSSWRNRTLGNRTPREVAQSQNLVDMLLNLIEEGGIFEQE